MVPALPTTASATDLVVMPPIAVCLLDLYPGLIRSMWVPLFVVVKCIYFILSVTCPNFVLDVGTAMLFLFIASWNICNDM